MGKKLIVTEKPSVGRQFAEALKIKGGNNDGYIENGEWVITWCIGHLLTMAMPQEYDPALAKWRLDDLPFLPEKYRYTVIRSVSGQFKTVKSLLNRKDIDEIYNAGDSGREGEYIQRLVYSKAKIRSDIPVKRIWINSQTDEEILRGIREAKPDSDYNNLAAAAYERAIADYAVGINLSRALSCKYGSYFNGKIGFDTYVPIAVGRVMSCVLGIIVDREREIKDFRVTDFYKLKAKCGGNFSWKAVEGTKYHESPLLYNDSGFKEEKDALTLLTELDRDSTLTCISHDEKEQLKYAPPLYNLADLQADLSHFYKISPDRALALAQSLYEKKLTTYPRTDARVMSTAAAKEVRKILIGLKAIPEVAANIATIFYNSWHLNITDNKRYTDDSKVTDHYAIIPTGYTSEVASLSREETLAYNLILHRFLAIFFPPAKYTKISITMEHSCGEQFFASEKYLTEAGYLGVFNDSKERISIASAHPLSSICEGTNYNAIFAIEKGKTHAPSRYTSGEMISVMEGAGKFIDDPTLRAEIKGRGIGTSATRAEIVKKLIDDRYVESNPKTLVLKPTQAGEVLYDILKDTLPQMLNPKMTASWEQGLGMIETGQITAADYRQKLEQFVIDSVSSIKAKKVDDSGGKNMGVARKSSKIVGTCPRCGKEIVEYEKSYSCVGYRDNPKCTFTLWKNNALLAKSGKSITPQMAKSLLGKGETRVQLTSAKGLLYTVVLKLRDLGHTVDLEVTFPKSRNGRKSSSKSKNV